MIGRDIGSLLQVTCQFRQIYGDPPVLAFNSENYLDWVNTLLPQGVLLEVNHAKQEPFYLSRVLLTLYHPDREDDDDRELEEQYKENYRQVEELLGLHHMAPCTLTGI